MKIILIFIPIVFVIQSNHVAAQNSSKISGFLIMGISSASNEGLFLTCKIDSTRTLSQNLEHSVPTDTLTRVSLHMVKDYINILKNAQKFRNDEKILEFYSKSDSISVIPIQTSFGKWALLDRNYENISFSQYPIKVSDIKLCNGYNPQIKQYLLFVRVITLPHF